MNYKSQLRLDASRRDVLGYGGAALLSLAGCGGGSTSQPEEPPRYAAVLTNNIPQALGFNVTVNGQAFFTDDAAVLADIDRRVAGDRGRKFALEVYRLLASSHRNVEPLTSARWAHAPALYLNSLGLGLCDDVASAFAAIVRLAGLPARVWTFGGHVVAELFIEGRWEMYDPDLGVYYLNRQGLPCGVEELIADTSLITQPTLAPAPSWATEIIALAGQVPSDVVQYSQFLADIYGTRDDNLISLWYDDIAYTYIGASPLYLPIGAKMRIGPRVNSPTTTAADRFVADTASLKLEVPISFAGGLAMPFVPTRIAGTGRVRIDGMAFELSSAELGERLADVERPISAVEVLDLRSTLIVEYLVNAARYGLGSVETVTRIDVDAAALSVVRVEVLA